MDGKSPLPPRIVKTYEIIKPAQFKGENFEIRENGRPILWVTTRSMPFEPPRIDFESSTILGHPVVAVAKLIEGSNGCRVHLGDPSNLAQPRWELVACENPEQGIYHLNLGWRSVRWEKSPPRFGPRRPLENKLDFRLFDQSGGQLLLECTEESVESDQVARLDYMVDDGKGMELMGLAALFGILESTRRSKRKRSWPFSKAS